MNGAKMKLVLAVLVVGTVCVAAATASQLAATAGPTYKKVGSWGKGGTANGQFQNAFGIAPDKSGNVYVADTDNNRIQVFTAKGGFLRKWGSAGSATGQFLGAQDVAIDLEGNTWVADRGNERLQQFSGSGAHLLTIAVGGQPLGVAVATNGSVFVTVPNKVVRYDKVPSGYAVGASWGGLQAAGDVAASADGSVYVADVRGAPPTVKRFDSSGKLLKTIKLPLPATAGAGAQVAIGADLDCNLWATVIPQRNLVKYSPAGKSLATAASPDLIGVAVGVGPTGDLYVTDNGTSSIVHFAEDKAKPATAAVPGKITVSKGKATIKYSAAGIACPAQVDATASLTGKGIAGKATVKVAAGKTTRIAIPVRAKAGTTRPATFKIVLKTNGRTTTQTRKVTVAVAK